MAEHLNILAVDWPALRAKPQALIVAAMMVSQGQAMQLGPEVAELAILRYVQGTEYLAIARQLFGLPVAPAALAVDLARLEEAADWTDYFAYPFRAKSLIKYDEMLQLTAPGRRNLALAALIAGEAVTDASIGDDFTPDEVARLRAQGQASRAAVVRSESPSSLPILLGAVVGWALLRWSR